jgi:hypothetical protein
LLTKNLLEPTPHWPILGWNVSKSWLQKMDIFENYAFVAMQSDNVTFYACKIVKGTPGFNLKKTNFFTRWRQHSKNSWYIFQMQITLLLWRPQDPQGCHFWSFSNFLGFGPNFSAPNYQIWTQWIILLL